MEGARVVACDVPLVARRALRTVTGIEPHHPRPGAREPQRRRATLHEIIAQLRTRQDLLVRTGVHHRVDQGVPAAEEARLVLVRLIPQERVCVRGAPVGERPVDGAGLQPAVCRGEVLAARDCHGAQPVLVGRLARRAVAHQGKLLRLRSFTGDLCHGLVEAIIERAGVVVVELAEYCSVGEGVGVAGHGVGDFVAEGEVEDKVAVGPSY